MLGMCGICGKIYFDESKTVSTQEIRDINQLLHHRGPDEEGYHISGNTGLGHKRLSIIDLKTGQQPISNETGTATIIFNGEVYNFRGLRQDLLKKGHQFKTNSDTEVILHLYEEYGESCVEHLRGMFAFAIWDETKKQCFLARDRVGKKPIFYALVHDCFVFASELKALLVVPGVSRDIDYEALNYFLSFQYIPAPHTIYKSVKKLEPAHTCFLKTAKPISNDTGTLPMFPR